MNVSASTAPTSQVPAPTKPKNPIFKALPFPDDYLINLRPASYSDGKAKAALNITDSKWFPFNGHLYQINQAKDSGVRSEQLTSYLNEIYAMSQKHSKLFLFRLDFHVPEGTTAAQGNRYMSALFKTLRVELLKEANAIKDRTHKGEIRNRFIKDVAYGWTREFSEAKKLHYHCWICFPQRYVRTTGFVDKPGTMTGLLTKLWMKITNGPMSLVTLTPTSERFPENHYTMLRKDPDTFGGAIFWISYLAKEKTKEIEWRGPKTYGYSGLYKKWSNQKKIDAGK